MVDVEDALKYRASLYVLKIIQAKLINHHHNNLMSAYSTIIKTCQPVARKYY